MTILFLILGLLLFVGLVVVHEWGHFIMARRNGVDVDEFGIGFPPRIKAWKVKGRKTERNKHLPASAHKGFEFTLNWLPLGGFVKLHGEHDADTEPGTFGAATTLAKTKIMAAGIVMNLITAFVLFTIVGWIGMPSVIAGQYTLASNAHVVNRVKNKDVVKLTQIKQGSPADKAGIKDGDQLVSIAGKRLTLSTDLPGITKSHAGQTVSAVVKRDGKQLQKQVHLNTTSPYMGTAAIPGGTGYDITRYTWGSPVVALGMMGQFTVLTFKGLGTALAGLGKLIAGLVTFNHVARSHGQADATGQVGGPLAILALLGAGSSQGLAFVLFIIAVISLSLALMNVLPIPALDGGKLFITYLWRIFGKKVPQNVEDYIYTGSFLVLMGLFVLITISDAGKIDFRHLLG